MIKRGINKRFTTVEKFYDRIMYYKLRPTSPGLQNDYHKVLLDGGKIYLSFYSPNHITVMKNDILSTHKEISVDEAIKLLNPYLRKQKLMKIMK